MKIEGGGLSFGPLIGLSAIVSLLFVITTASGATAFDSTNELRETARTLFLGSMTVLVGFIMAFFGLKSLLHAREATAVEDDEDSVVEAEDVIDDDSDDDDEVLFVPEQHGDAEPAQPVQRRIQPSREKKKPSSINN